MENETISLYEYICKAVVDGHLPNCFSLPQEEDETKIRWMDGSLDGVSVYHMGVSEMPEDGRALMIEAVRTASDGKFEEADRLFTKLGQGVHAIAAIDELQSYIIDHKSELSAECIHGYAVHALVTSTDRECLKYALSIFELFDTDGNKGLKRAIRTVGLSDEFSLFSIFVMLRWADGNNEVFQLAKKIHGWGRIHAIERIEPSNEEIRDWLLKEGVHNEVMSAYSALTCWEKSDAGKILQGIPTREEFSGIRDIIEGLLDEGPVPGISQVEDADKVMIRFLELAGNMNLELDDYDVIRVIRIYYENENVNHVEIVSLCRKLLESERCRKVVADAVKKGKAIDLARDLNLEIRDDLFVLLREAFDEHYHLCRLLVHDSFDRAAVMDLFRQKLPLKDMKTKPTNSHGLGSEYKRQQQLEHLVQELRYYPMEGIDFVETALQSAPIRTRNMGIAVLEEWVDKRKTPLAELLPETYTLLCSLRDIETDEKIRKRMDGLIAGDIPMVD